MSDRFSMFLKSRPIVLVGNYLVLIFMLALWTNSSLAKEKDDLLTYNHQVKTKLGSALVEIHYERKLGPLLKRVVSILDNKVPSLVKYFEHVPSDVVHIYLRSDVNVANGSATVLPRNYIEIYNRPSTYFNHLSQSANWLEILLVHEYTHIIHLDKTEGLLSVLSTIFGSIGKLGGVTPRWFTEGVGVWAESKYTRGGRLKSDLFRHEVESFLITNDFCTTIDCIDEPGIFPHGSSAYWVGSFFLDYLERKKPGTLKCLIKGNSNSFPFFLNTAFEECGFKSAVSAYNKFRAQESWRLKKIQQKNFKDYMNKGFKSFKLTSGRFDLGKNFQVIKDRVYLNKYDDFVESIVGVNLNDLSEVELRVPGFMNSIEKSHKGNLELVFSNSKGTSPATTWRTYRGAGKEAFEDFVPMDLELADDSGLAHYSFVHRNKTLVFMYESDRYHLYLKKGEALEKIKTLPRFTTLTTPYRVGNVIYFKSFSGSKDVLLEFNLDSYKLSKKLVSSKLYLKGVCGGDLLLNINNISHVVRGNRYSKIKNNKLNNVLLLRASKTHTAFIDKYVYGQVLHKKTNCKNLYDVDSRSSRKLLSKKDPKVKSSRLYNKNVERYLSFKHFLPKYWFFNYSYGNNLDALTIFTQIIDPLKHHNFSLAANYYFNQKETTPQISYTYTLGDWSFFLAHSNFLSTTSLSSIINDQKFSRAGLGYSYSNNHLSLVPTLYVGQEEFTDFISSRQSKNAHLDTTLNYTGYFADSFYQYSNLNLDLYYNDVEERVSHYGVEAVQNTIFRPHRRLDLRIRNSYGYLDKSDFTSGVIYGGGHFGGKHMFYGLPYSDVFGNEVHTGKAELKFRLVKRYAGSGLFPLFLKRIHLLGGTDYIKADRIFLNQRFLRNEKINSTYLGVSFDVTLFYLAKLQMGFILANVKDPLPTNPDSSSFLLTVNGQFL